LSGRGLCDELITRPEEFYRLCCVVVCDVETSRIGAPYIYDISRLRVKCMEYGTYQNVCNVSCCYKLQSLLWHCEIQQLVFHTPKSFKQLIHEFSLQTLWFNHRHTHWSLYTEVIRDKVALRVEFCLCFFWFPLLITTHHCPTHVTNSWGL